jgi:hypothetical protein
MERTRIFFAPFASPVPGLYGLYTCFADLVWFGLVWVLTFEVLASERQNITVAFLDETTNAVSVCIPFTGDSIKRSM